MKNVWVLATAIICASSLSAVDVKKPQDRIRIIEKKPGLEPGVVVASPSAEYGYAPRVTLSFPTTLMNGVDTYGKATWVDSDDKVISVFLTVFFQDGDVGMADLYDTRDGDPAASAGKVTFSVRAPGYSPPLGSNGFAIVTVTDQALNITQISASFVVR